MVDKEGVEFARSSAESRVTRYVKSYNKDRGFCQYSLDTWRNSSYYGGTLVAGTSPQREHPQYILSRLPTVTQGEETCS